MSSKNSLFKLAFLFIIIMVVLPVGLSAAESVFKVRAKDESGTPIVEAKVVLWDVYNTSATGFGYTDDEGCVQIPLVIQGDPAATSRRRPNVGVAVFPDPIKNPGLAHTHTKVMFFNKYDVTAYYPDEIELVAPEGCKLTFDFRYDCDPYSEDNEPEYGIIRDAGIYDNQIPGNVTGLVAWFRHQACSFSDNYPATAPLVVYWPENSNGNVQIHEDNKRNDFNTDRYFSSKYVSFTVESLDQEIDILHSALPKGKVAINPDHSVATGTLRVLKYGSSTAEFYNDGPVWIPYGTYDMVFTLGNERNCYLDDEGFSPPPRHWSQVLVASEPLQLDYTTTQGTALTFEICLGDETVQGDPQALAHAHAKLLKLVEGQWGTHLIEIQKPFSNIANNSRTEIDAEKSSSRFLHRLDEGKYRIDLYSSSKYSTSGVVDTHGSVPLCFSCVSSEEFEVGPGHGQMTQTIRMPLASAVYATVEATLVDYVFDQIRVGHLALPGQENGYELAKHLYACGYDDQGGADNVRNVFVPFVQEGKMVIRCSLRHRDHPEINLAYHKVFAPVTVTADSGTIVLEQPYLIEEKNFIEFAGAVHLDEQPYSGPANILISPIIEDTEIYGHRVFYKGQIPEERGFEKVNLTNGASFAFAIEKDVDHLITVIEQDVWPKSLKGIQTHKEVINKSASVDDVVISLRNNRGYINVKLLLEGEDVLTASESLTISLRPRSNNHQARSEIVQGSSFRVSGLETGYYDIFVDLDNMLQGLDQLEQIPDSLFIQQANPVLRRELFIDSLASATDEFVINLDTQTIGFLSGQVVDDQQKPIAGVRLAVAPNDYQLDRDNLHEAVFFCSTDEVGKIVVDSAVSTFSVPLEAGRYSLYAYGLMEAGFDHAYNLGDENYFRKIAEFDIKAGNTTILPGTSVSKLFAIEGQLKLDGKPLTHVGASLRKFDKGRIRYVYGFVTDSDGNFMLSEVTGGDYIFFVDQSDEPEQSVKTLYTASFKVDTQGKKNQTFNIEFSSADLTEYQFRFLPDDELARLNGPICFFEGADGLPAPEKIWQGLNYVIGRNTKSGKLVSFKYDATGLNDYFNNLSLAFYPQNYVSHHETSYLTYYAPEPFVLDADVATEYDVQWSTGKELIVNVDSEKKYEHLYGILVEKSNCFGEIPYGTIHSQKNFSIGLGYLNKTAKIAMLKNNQLNFSNLSPDNEYVLMLYEASELLTNDDKSRIYGSNNNYSPEIADLLWRHVEHGIIVKEDSEIKVSPGPVATVKFSADPPDALVSPDQVMAYFTSDPLNTMSKMGWPAIYINRKLISNAVKPITPIIPEVVLPAKYAYRFEYQPGFDYNLGAPMPYQAVTEENIILDEEWQTHTFRPARFTRVEGKFISDSHTSGYIYFSSEGSESEVMYNSQFLEAYFSLLMNPGKYNGFAIPYKGAAHFFSCAISADEHQELVLKANPSIEVTGKVLDLDKNIVRNTSVVVYRKFSPRSELDDGQKMIPYPVFQQSHFVPVDVHGQVRFFVESDVDYYVQAVAPVGQRPAMPIKISVKDQSPEPFEVRLIDGLQITGMVNTKATIAAYPAGVNAIQESYSAAAVITAAAFQESAEKKGMYEFTLSGLEQGMVYDLTVTPESLGYAIKKLSNVAAGTELKAVELEPAIALSGSLVDQHGNKISQAGVNVELIMQVGESALVSSDITAETELSTPIRASELVVAPLKDYHTEIKLTAVTNREGKFSFKSVPAFVCAILKTNSGFSNDGNDYALADTGYFLPNQRPLSVEKDIVVGLAGSIVGRLINEMGLPIANGRLRVEKRSGNVKVVAPVGSDGSFQLRGLPTGADYTLTSEPVPGRLSRYINNLLVAPNKITDVGAIVLPPSVNIGLTATNLIPVLKRAFEFGHNDKTDLRIVAFDSLYSHTDSDLLNNDFATKLNGAHELTWNSASTPERLPVSFAIKSGRQSLGMLFEQKISGNAATIVTWGWVPSVNVPTSEQLDGKRFEPKIEIESPKQFGSISGVVKYSTDPEVVFGPEDVVIAIYPVDKSGDLLPVMLPVAMTRAFNNKWKVEHIPQGSYRIKLITRKYGSHFFRRIVEIKDQPVVEDISLGNVVRNIIGRVVDAADGTGVSDAGVRMILHDLATTTDDDGYYSFIVPYGKFINVQLEIMKPGYRALRQIAFKGVSQKGQKIVENVNLGTAKLKAAKGKAKIKIVDDSGNVVVGAEVALILSQRVSDSLNVYTVADTQTTGNSGVVRFRSVPVEGKVSFRVRGAHYEVKTVTLESSSNIKEIITISELAPKVFYTGFPVQKEEENRNFKAQFDFNRAVAREKLKFMLGDAVRTSELHFPDDLGNGKITSMIFEGEVEKDKDLLAVIEYFGHKIGSFKSIGIARYKRELPVEPMSDRGFTGRVSDENGNQLPVGLTVPPGYLSPEIESFEVEVNDKPEETAVNTDDNDDEARIAGPTFSFTFNRGTHHAADTQHKGLFEITIQYEPGKTNLEPRWKDTNGNWSKVGIVKESIRWDHPETGYVTFKVDHLTEFAVLSGVSGSSSSLAGDFNGDNVCNLTDIAIYMAWLSKNRTSKISTIKTEAERLYPRGAPINPVNLPVVGADDFNVDGSLNLSDIAIYMGWLAKNRTSIEGVIDTEAGRLYPSIKGNTLIIPSAVINR